MFRTIHECRICHNRELVDVLDLGVQALTGVFPSKRDQPVTAGPLRLVKCTGGEDVCGLLQLQHSYDLGELYGDNYGYRSGLNASMVTHLHAKVRRILERVKLPKRALIIDIGSNDGTTLRAFPSEGNTLVGIDPTGTKFQYLYPEHVQLIPDFFSAEKVKDHFHGRKASIITSFSMLYDLEEPLSFIQGISDVLDEEGVWAFEQSYMPTMLRRNSYDTVCHEHLEYYALKQIKWMMDKVGLKLIDIEFNDVNGGSVSVMASKRDSDHPESIRVAEILENEVHAGLDTLEPYRAFLSRVSGSRAALRTFLEEAKRCGNTVGALGASTKGNVVLQYCNVSSDDIGVVGEINGDKYGHFTPGTLLPIVSEDEALAMNSDYLLVLPWHFRPAFMSSKKLAGRNLVFPLPEFDVARCGARGSSSFDTRSMHQS